MKKYIKYILITIILILVIGSIVLYINYSNENNDNNNIDNDSEVNELYNNDWYISKLSFYTAEGSFIELDMSGNGYLKLTEEYIYYCSSFQLECQRYTNSYENGRIRVPVDNLVDKGLYKVLLDNNILKLSKIVDEKEVIYTFTLEK